MPGPTKQEARVWLMAVIARGELVYPKHRFQPEDTLTFIQSPIFEKVWDELGLSSIDVHGVEVAIMASPKSGKVVRGTRGLRKLRFAPPSWNVGKRGALRVLYVYFEEHKKVYLALVYPKTKKDTMTAEEKTRINRALERVEKEFDR